MAKTSTTKEQTTKKTTTRQPKRKQIILDYNYAITAAIIGTLIISIIQGLAFYNIAEKITNGNYAASKIVTVLTSGSVILIGIVIVILFILLISQKED